MSETAADMPDYRQEANAAYVYSLGNSRSDPAHENNPTTTDWRSFFKHPPSNLRFKRNPSSSKIVVNIPCRPSNTERTTQQQQQQLVKLPPPPKSATLTKKLASRDTPSTEKLHLGAVAVPSNGLLLHKIHDHSGSAGDSSSCADSTSPTSQIYNNETIDLEDHDHDVFAREDEHTKTQEEEEEEDIGRRECFGFCSVCGLGVYDDGCVADEKVYHNKCFVCQKCDRNIASESFYVVQGEILCANDYILTLDRCVSCSHPISDQVVSAEGHSYHLSCFKCSDCGMCLDGIPYAVDFSNKLYCVQDYHRTFAPRCQTCEEPILPNKAEPNSKRLIAMNMNFHVGCYCCVECGMSLVSDDADSEPLCFPFDQYPLCLDCNKMWSLRRHSAQHSPAAITNEHSSSSISEHNVS